MKNWWIIPFVLAVSKSNINGDAEVYTLHILMIFAVGIVWRKKGIKPPDEDPELTKSKAQKR